MEKPRFLVACKRLCKPLCRSVGPSLLAWSTQLMANGLVYLHFLIRMSWHLPSFFRPPACIHKVFGCFSHKNSLHCQQWIQLYLPPEYDKLNTEISFCLSTLSDSMFYCHKSWWFMWNIVAFPIDDGRCNSRLAHGLACHFACCVVSELSWCLTRCLAHCFALMKIKMKMK